MRYRYFETLVNQDGDDPHFSIQDDQTGEIVGILKPGKRNGVRTGQKELSLPTF